MCNTLIGNTRDGCAIRGDAAGTSAASRLSLAAAPTFIVMALCSAVAGGPAEMMCSNGGSALSLNSMVAMYALMSIFHLSPWLTLLSNWRKWKLITGLTVTAQRKRTSARQRTACEANKKHVRLTMVGGRFEMRIGYGRAAIADPPAYVVAGISLSTASVRL